MRHTSIPLALAAAALIYTAQPNDELVDIAGNTVSNQTQLGSIDMRSSTAGGLKAFVISTTGTITDAVNSVMSGYDTTYSRFSGMTNVNQSIQYLQLDSTVTNIVIDIPVGNAMTKDWLVYVIAATNVSLTLPPGQWWSSSSSVTNDISPGVPTGLHFSQVTDGIFSIGRQELTTSIIIPAPLSSPKAPAGHR